MTFNYPLWLIPLLPILGSLFILFFSKKMCGKTAGIVASLGVGLSFLWAVFISIVFVSGAADPKSAIHQVYWNWLNVDFIRSDAAFFWDRITMVFVLVVTGVGFLVHLFSTSYMKGDEGERRYFAYLSLFVASMLILVLADNAIFMFLGWEGVGACSFALIGHYYQNNDNVKSALKAFFVTRFGDVFLMLGIILMSFAFTVQFTSLDEVFSGVILSDVHPYFGISNGTLIIIAGLLLLGGAAGKSAQLPLQTWLPDAMAGPTPVSALIHAATMVTAGIYLIIRFHPLFAVSPELMSTVAIIGVLTAFYGATCALVQSDIKRILAFSTISQIGYMFLALGVGGFSLALFHFFTHAFYKALLFLGAGTVIHSLYGEQNVYKMGGLKKDLPGVYKAMLIGSAALAGIVLTSGFFSKDAILWSSLTTDLGNPVLYGMGLFTALLTAIYSFRLINLVFEGKPRSEVHVHKPDGRLTLPLYILAVPALFAGLLNIPGVLTWEHYFGPLFGQYALEPSHNLPMELVAAAGSAILAFVGWGIAKAFFGPTKLDNNVYIPATAIPAEEIQIPTKAPYRSTPMNFLFRAWDFDALYQSSIVTPYKKLSKVFSWIDEVLISGLYEAISVVLQLFHGFFVTMQNGRITRYATYMLFGAVIIVFIILFVSPKVF